MNGELQGLNARAQRIVEQAADEARRLSHSSIGTEHILLSLVNAGDGIGTKALESMGVSPDTVRQQLTANAGHGRFAPSGQIGLTPQARKMLDLSRREAQQLRHKVVGTEHILLGLIRQGDGVAARVLMRLGVTLDRARQEVIKLRHGYQGRKPHWPSDLPNYTIEADPEPRRDADPPVALERFARNLSQQAREGKLDPGVSRKPEVERVVEVLAQPTAGNPVLVHGTSTGRIALAEGLAQRLASEEPPESIRGKQLYYFDPESVATDVTSDGAHEPQPSLSEIVTSILDEARSRHDIILFLDNMPMVLGAAKSPVDVHGSLVPMLSGGQLRIIGATSLLEYCTYLGNDAALSPLLQPVYTAEPAIAYTIGMLEATMSVAAHSGA